MLEYRLTPHQAGVALWGDSAALVRLHEFIHHVVEECDQIEDKEGFVISLAYDIRKAYQGQRSQDFRDHPETDRCSIYGVELLWPLLLVQVGVLRQAMAFMPTNKLDQAIMFEFEFVVECAVREAMPITADEVIHRIRQLGCTSYIHLDKVLDGRCRYFIELPANKRLKVLPRLMETFDPMYELLAGTGGITRAGYIAPEAFELDGQFWPDFEW